MHNIVKAINKTYGIVKNYGISALIEREGVNSMLKLYTAQYKYNGLDRLDVTREYGYVKCITPPWRLVKGYKSGEISEKEYETEYFKYLDKMQEMHPDKFVVLLQQKKITFVCFCKHDAFCHRKLLAKWFEITFMGNVKYIMERKKYLQKESDVDGGSKSKQD